MLNACRTSLHWLASSQECRASATSMNLNKWQQLGTRKNRINLPKLPLRAALLALLHGSIPVCFERLHAAKATKTYVDMRDPPATWFHWIPFHLSLQKMFIFHKPSELQSCWSSRLGLDDHAASIQIKRIIRLCTTAAISPWFASEAFGAASAAPTILGFGMISVSSFEWEYWRIDTAQELMEYWKVLVGFHGSSLLLTTLA